MNLKSTLHRLYFHGFNHSSWTTQWFYTTLINSWSALGLSPIHPVQRTHTLGPMRLFPMVFPAYLRPWPRPGWFWPPFRCSVFARITFNVDVCHGGSHPKVTAQRCTFSETRLFFGGYFFCMSAAHGSPDLLLLSVSCHIPGLPWAVPSERRGTSDVECVL